MTKHLIRLIRLAETAADWATRSAVANVAGTGISELDLAWARVENLMETAYESGRNSHDDLIHIDKIAEIQSASRRSEETSARTG